MGYVIKEWDLLSQEIARHREAGARVVTTNGVFDLLHVGHVRYLQQARQLGDLLVVGVNSDACTRLLKGDSRPIVPEEERMEILAALACVDFVTLFHETTPIAWLEVIRPDVHAKGGDYDIEKMPETAVVRSHGGTVVTLPFVVDHSTTELIRRLEAR